MSTKNVQQILPPPAPHMVGDGFRVHNFFPGGYNIDKKRMSPFFMLDYNSKIDFAPKKGQPRGVGVHPHRGFETVTIVYEGKLAHGDSYGHQGVIGKGDVQWMTAASGVLHKEYHEENFSREGGLFHVVQLWVNLPAKDKMSMPKYQEITNDKMGIYTIDDKGSKVEVIAGDFKGVKGAASTFTPMNVYNLHLKKGSSITFELDKDHNTGMLMVEGSAVFNGTDEAPADNFVLFKNDGETVAITAMEDAIILVLSGEPIHEPIANYGPFVMNTAEELQQAIKDVNEGKFGYLED